MTDSRRSIDLGFTDERIQCGSHICYIYSDDDERLDVLTQYLRAGREAGEKIEFYTHSLSPHELREEMNRLGFAPDVSDIDPASDRYYPDGSFDVEAMLSSLIQVYTEACEAGYSGARVTGELNWLDREVPGADHILEYEARLTNVLAEHPSTAVCQYDARLFSGDFLTDVLQVHPYMIVAGQLIRNPYFTQPERFLNECHQPRSAHERLA